MDLTRIVELVKERKATGGESMPQNSKAFLKGLQDEVQEVSEALKENKRAHLEDELGDILWDYLHLLYSLEAEEKITVEQVLARCKKKYAERVQARDQPGKWAQIKARQKRELDEESKNKF